MILITEHEGFAVGALYHCGILLMRTHANGIKRTVVALTRVVGALCHSTLDLTVAVFLVHFSVLSLNVPQDTV